MLKERTSILGLMFHGDDCASIFLYKPVAFMVGLLRRVDQVKRKRVDHIFDRTNAAEAG